VDERTRPFVERPTDVPPSPVVNSAVHRQEIANEASDVFIAAGLFDEARDVLTPREPLEAETMPDHWRNLAVLGFARGDDALGESSFRELVTAYPNDPPAEAHGIVERARGVRSREGGSARARARGAGAALALSGGPSRRRDAAG